MDIICQHSRQSDGLQQETSHWLHRHSFYHKHHISSLNFRILNRRKMPSLPIPHATVVRVRNPRTKSNDAKSIQGSPCFVMRLRGCQSRRTACAATKVRICGKLLSLRRKRINPRTLHVTRSADPGCNGTSESRWRILMKLGKCWGSGALKGDRFMDEETWRAWSTRGCGSFWCFVTDMLLFKWFIWQVTVVFPIWGLFVVVLFIWIKNKIRRPKFCFAVLIS